MRAITSTSFLSALLAISCGAHSPSSSPPSVSGPTPAASTNPGVSPAASSDLPPGALYRVGSRSFALGGEARYIAFSNDGTRVAACGDGVGVRVWSLPKGNEISRAKPFYECTALSWMPGDQRIVVAGISSFEATVAPVVSIDAASGKITGRTGLESRNNVTNIVPIDATTVAVGGAGFSLWHIDQDEKPLEKIVWPDSSSSVKIAKGKVVRLMMDHVEVTDLTGGAKVCDLPFITGRDEACDVTPDGASFALLRDDAITFHSLATCEETSRISIPRADAIHIDDAGTVRTVTLSIGEPATVAKPLTHDAPIAVHIHQNAYSNHALSRDGRWFAAACGNGIEVADLRAHGSVDSASRHANPVVRVGLSRTDVLVTSSYDATYLWHDVRDGTLVAMWPGDTIPAGSHARSAWGPAAIRGDGGEIAVVADAPHGGIISVLDVGNGAEKWHSPTRYGGEVAYLGEKVLLLHDEGGMWLVPPEGEATELDARAFDKPEGIVGDRAGRYVGMWTATDSRLMVCTPKTCSFPKDANHPGWLKTLAIGDHELLATFFEPERDAPGAHTLRAYDPATLVELPVPGEIASASAVTIGATDGLAAAGFEDGRIAVLDASLHVTKSFQTDAAVTALAFSEDGSFLASGHADGTAIVWRR